MDPTDVSNVFATIVLLGAITTVVAALTPSLRAQWSRFALVVITIAAVGATAGSLYYSEVADYVPCTYCWYQRIAMYPIAVITPIALIARDRSILRSTLALSSIGLVISLYHVQLQLFPDQSSNSCDLTSPCTAKWVEAFGFMTIPQMAGTIFAIIVVTSIVGLRTPLPRPDGNTSDAEREPTSA